jgi:hypothetical protein
MPKVSAWGTHGCRAMMFSQNSIFVIEDDPGMRQSLGGLLRAHGFHAVLIRQCSIHSRSQGSQPNNVASAHPCISCNVGFSASKLSTPMSQYRTWIRIKSRKVPQQHVMGAGSPSKSFTRDVLIEQQDAHRHQQLQSTNNPTEANVLNSATESAVALGYNRRANAPISRPPVICQLRPSLHRDCFVASAIWFQVGWLRSAFVRLNPIALCAANSNSNPTAQDEP